MIRTVLIVCGVLFFVSVLMCVWGLMRISSMVDRMEESQRGRDAVSGSCDGDGVERNTCNE